MSITFPAEGIPYEGLLFRLPEPEDVDTLAPAFRDDEIAGGADLPPLTPAMLRKVQAQLPEYLEDGWILPLVVLDTGTGEIQGAATLHHFDAERDQVEIGLRRAGSTREGVLRSLPLRNGRRVDQALYSLLPGE